MNADQLCSACKKNVANEPHACPYMEEFEGSTDNEYCTRCAVHVPVRDGHLSHKCIH